jgi:hypothetical protein
MQDVQTRIDLPDVVFVERRHAPDRRIVWRGGRRNTDWMNRPIGAWRQLEQRGAGWRHWLAKLPLTHRHALTSKSLLAR